jgi:hypothetical protein
VVFKYWLVLRLEEVAAPFIPGCVRIMGRVFSFSLFTRFAVEDSIMGCYPVVESFPDIMGA